MTTMFRALSLCFVFSLLAGCTQQQTFESSMVSEAHVTDRTRATDLLARLPSPSDKIVVALYDFQDQTGQFKNNDKYTDYSSAVTKGGHAILTKALLDAGSKQWFTVIERGGLKNLLQERQIIKVMRTEYHPGGERLPQLPPLLYGGMMIEGGIISYDSNVVTGGAGAIYLGIGTNVQYHRDMVTVYLRAVSTQTGEVLLSVTSSKTLFSTLVDSNVLKYITFDRLLQAEAGFSVNEPTQLAVRQAVETAVYSLVMEGAIDHVWDFKDPAAGQRAIAEYLQRRDGPVNDTPIPGMAPPRMAEAAPAAPAPVAHAGPVVELQPVAEKAEAAPVAPVQSVAMAPMPAPVPAPAPKVVAAAPVTPLITPAAAPAQQPPVQVANSDTCSGRHFFKDSPYQQHNGTACGQANYRITNVNYVGTQESH